MTTAVHYLFHSFSQFILLPLLFILLSPKVFAQTIYSGFRQYTANDGLPSSEVYDLLQDDVGHIWISTDNGVSCFNGYTFRNYGAVDGLQDPVAFYLQKDQVGHIWIQTMSGKLYWFEQDRMHPFGGNRILDSLGMAGFMEYPFFVDSIGTVMVPFPEYGLMRFDRKGSLMPLSDPIPGQQLVVYGEKALLLPYFVDKEEDSKLSSEDTITLTILYDDSSYGYQIPYRSEFAGGSTILMSDGTLILCLYGYLYAFREGKKVLEMPYPEVVLHWHQNSEGLLFAGLYGRKGVRKYDSLEDLIDGRFQTLLDGFSVSHILEDREGGYWFGTTEAGIFYQPDPAIRIYDRRAGLPVDYVTALAPTGKTGLFFGLEGGGVWKMNLADQSIMSLPAVGNRINTLYFDDIRNQLWAGVNLKIRCYREGTWYNNPELQPIETNEEPYSRYGRHFHATPDGNSIWVSYVYGFHRRELATGQISFSSFQAGMPNKKVLLSRTLDVLTTRSGHTWVGNVYGLFELSEGHELLPQHNHPAFGVRVEALAELPDSTLVIGSKGYGLIFKQGDRLGTLNEADGLTSNMIENLYVDAEGTLWAGTLNGLNKIQWSWAKPPLLWQITLHHGLPSNEITDVCRIDSTLWIGTTHGLVQFDPISDPVISMQPCLKSVRVNERKVSGENSLRLNYKENNLILDYYTINYKMAGRIPYRYRLDGGVWVFTSDTRISFSALSPGRSLIEIQSQNEDQVWSESLEYEFRILPPWWQTWAAKLIGLIFFFGLLWSIYRTRTNQLKRANQVQYQLNELEKSALQAQMNPHFIFNCLGAIQHYILQNEKELAIDYLGKFARLIRGVLNASVTGKVSLDREIQLLDDYLRLEQLRFDHRFEYEILVPSDLDQLDLEIPPLLIQPYVENAVLHGLHEKKTGGIIRISFRQDGPRLLVQVTDNGKGIQSAQGEIDKPHKAVGMSITRRRLELIGNSLADDLVQIKTCYDIGGIVAGTEVTIGIPVAYSEGK